MRAALNAAARDNIIPLTILLVVLYVVAGGYRLYVVGTINDPIVLGEFASAIGTLLLLIATIYGDLRGHWVHVILISVALIASADSLMQLIRSGAGWDTTNLAIVICATGLVSLSFLGSAIVYAVTWGGWLWVRL